MPIAVTRFVTVSTLFAVILFLIPVVVHKAHDYVGYVIFLEFVVLLPLLVVTAGDALSALNSNAHGSLVGRIAVRVVASVPAFIFGLLSLVCGAAIILWVLYNLFIERQPEFTSSWLAGFGIGPALLLFGIGLLISVFRTSAPIENNGIDEKDT